MHASVVIPVWNGASVILGCLEALFAHSGDVLLEVICVDNASRDESASLIAARCPNVRLIRQPINLGFAGGANAGIDVAQGDVFVLLNQDTAVNPGWLEALTKALEENPGFGIAGCTILKPDGTVQHAGAMITRPEAYGEHLVDIGDGRPRQVEYVTGAAFAIRRETWNVVGRFDEGYYPVYYEESDYCYRAHRKGIEIVYVPEARVTHMFTSREALIDPIRLHANHYRSRYRFVSKHFDTHEVGEFFEAEYAAVEHERYFAYAVGRAIAARDTLRGLADILERRRSDLGDVLTPVHRRQLQVGFTQILRQSFSISERLSPSWAVELFPGIERRQDANRRPHVSPQWKQNLRQRIYAPSPDHSASVVRQLSWLFVRRPLRFIVDQARLFRMVKQMDLILQEIYRRLHVLEVLTDYDYR